MDKSYSEWDFDVVVIGAGGAGLRAAIEASSNGAKVGMISKSMLGKAHTVMAEGGAAAALANRDHRDCLLYTSPSPRDRTRSRMPSSA